MPHDHPVTLTVPRSLLRSLVPGAAASSLVHDLIRPEDQVRLRFELVNGRIDRDTDPTSIVRLEPEEPIYYQIWFGPQHLVEAPIGTGVEPPGAGSPRASRISGESRIVVKIPEGTPFTVASLLDLAAFALVLDERAQGDADGTDAPEPTSAVTAIEVPASLVLSPTRNEQFTAAPTPITRGDITELWRARLARVESGIVTEPPEATPLVRAIWSRTDDPSWNPPRPLNGGDRDELVKQTTGKDSVPIPVHGLWLSSQGAFLDADGEWAQGVLASYRHRVVTGRDLHVEVVERGYLAPFGHPASITTLTERVYLADENGESTASLTSEEIIAITLPTVENSEDFHPYIPSGGRGLPFRSLTASDPGSGPIGSRSVVLPNSASIRQENARIITRNGEDIRISYRATDRGGRADIAFDLPAVFVSDAVAYQPRARVGSRRTALDKLARWFAEDANLDFSIAELNGQAVSWAEPPADPGRGPSGSVQTTNRIRFRLDRPDTVANDPDAIEEALKDASRPAFYPAVEHAWIVDLASTAAFGGEPSEIEVRVAQRYLDEGTDEANADLGYLDLIDGIEITPAGDAPGMFSTSLNIKTFGQRLGAGMDLFNNGWEWDPLDALAGLPRLLGNLELADLVGNVDIGADLSDRGLPKMEVELIPAGDITAPPSGVCVHFTWEPELRSYPADVDNKTFVVTDDFADAGIEDPFGGESTHALLSLSLCTPNSRTFEASLDRFALQVPPFVPAVAILFERIRFRHVNGESTLDTDIADWMFINQLGWLEPVKDFLLGSLGLGAPAFEGGVFIDFNLPIPGLTLGVINVHGLQVALGIDLPDEGASAVDFAMSSREDPFTITVFGVGGNGSFGLRVDASRILYVEGSLAVTYELAVDVFIVAASVSVSLGAFVIYEEEEVTLGAYAVVSGSLSFIGIVKITGSVTVALIYRVNNKLLRGVAAVSGEVSSPFGKSSVTRDVAVEVAIGDGSSGKRRMGVSAVAATGEAGVLSFQDRFSETQWTEYCSAFVA